MGGFGHSDHSEGSEVSEGLEKQGSDGSEGSEASENPKTKEYAFQIPDLPNPLTHLSDAIKSLTNPLRTFDI